MDSISKQSKTGTNRPSYNKLNYPINYSKNPLQKTQIIKTSNSKKILTPQNLIKRIKL